MSQLRPLGRSTLRVSPLAFGGNVFGWTADEATSFKLLDAWLDAGFNFVDTADVYSAWVSGHVGGESETIIGKWLKHSGKRNRLVLATKVGKPMGEGKVGLSPKYIREAVEASLKRLQTDYIDLYQSHDDDANTPLEDTLGTFDALIKEGKVRAIGASNYTAPRLAEALDVSERLGIARYESLQPLYNLYDRAVFEDALEPLCLKREVGVINFYALAAGFLTGKYRTEADVAKSARGTTTKKYLNPRGLRILDALDKVAQQYNAKPGQVAIAWQIARPGVTAPIASATSLAQLEELVVATQLKLDAGTIDMLDRASAETPV
ncbi:aldo/keto reductase [Variovorax boronicumulans]|uniref:aldo/keto reductase n=1 Tax=Variovorax boronicumulans TaxID=436515 RepID=UPI00085CB708|nr:aldo/keto reductase [Variovorax boronicumulans]OEZ32037.1 alcohol dehydrogenase [Variovorax boronicumulans]